MDPYGEIIHTVASTTPALIYVAIGCAQGHHAPENQTPQEFPPQIAAWHGPKFVILIDPALESPPVARVPADPPNTIFREVRRSFYWEDSRDAAFLSTLCDLASLSTGPHLIVQDYTGRDIRAHLPVHKYGRSILKKVLFDMTYADAGCFVDFTKVRILRNSSGDFVQPFFEPLSNLVGHLSTGMIMKEVHDRYNVLTSYAHRHIRMHTGREEMRDWCTPDAVAAQTERLFCAYGLAPGRGIPSMKRLLTEALFDFCCVAKNYMTEAEVAAAINGDYTECLRTLRVAIAAELETPAIR